MTSTVATPLFNISMDANSSEVMWTKNIPSSNETTRSFDGISTRIPVSLIGNGISTRGKIVTNVDGVTTLPGILQHSTDTITNSHSGGSSSVGLAVGVTVPVVIIAAVVVLILICVFRKRCKDKTRLNLELVFPDPSVVLREHGANICTETKRADVEDMDLQPSNNFMNQDILINHDENSAAESEQAFCIQKDSKPVIVIANILSRDDSRDKRVKLSEAGTITSEEIPSLNNASGGLSTGKKAFELSENTSSGYSLAKPVENDDRQNDLSKKVEEPSKDTGADDEVVVMRRARKDNTCNVIVVFETSEFQQGEIENSQDGDDSLAKPIENDDRQNDLSKTVEEPSKDKDADDEVYVAMQGAGNNEINVFGNSELQLGETENSKDSVYTNVVVRRVQSMQATSNWQNEQEENVQRRVLSETQGLSSRPPIAQPRLSKKKKFDPYDYLPGTQLQGPIDKLQTRSREQDHEEERLEGDDCSDLRAEELYMDMSNTSHAN